MKKKAIEKQAQQRLERINNLELLLRKRKEQIGELKEEIEGYKQVVQILEAFVIEGVEKKEEVQIPIVALSEGLKAGYNIDIKEDMYVITKRG